MDLQMENDKDWEYKRKTLSGIELPRIVNYLWEYYRDNHVHENAMDRINVRKVYLELEKCFGREYETGDKEC